MKFCPHCPDIEYSNSDSECPQHKVPLSLPDPYGLVGDETKKVIDGKYLLNWVVGKGGMAVIYCAHQVSMDRKVALKMPLQQWVDNKDFISLFEREAKNAGRLYHQNVAVIHDYGRANLGTGNKIPYLVMEWVEGITLEQKISKDASDTPATHPETESLSLEYTSYLLSQIAAALDASHKRGIIHRDIKPSNIMLIQDSLGREYIKMLDFGISKAISGVDTKTRVTQGLGTPLYGSPEQWREKDDINQTSDIYSLGIMLYQMLTGRLPFYHSNPYELIRMHTEEPPPRISHLRPDAIVVEELILKMMDKSRKNRQQSVMEIVDKFEEAIRPVNLKGQVVWNPENTDKLEPLSGAIIKLDQDQVADQVSDGTGYFSFDRILNTPPFRISTQADYFESRDDELKPGQSNSIRLIPRAVELSGKVFEETESVQPRELSNVDLMIEMPGSPTRSNFTTKTDNEGRFKIRLVGPQLAYNDTACIIHIDGFKEKKEFLGDKMRIIVEPISRIVDPPVRDDQVYCPKRHPYKRGNVPTYCIHCGLKILE